MSSSGKRVYVSGTILKKIENCLCNGRDVTALFENVLGLRDLIAYI